MTTSIFVRFSDSLIAIAAVSMASLTLYGCAEVVTGSSQAPDVPMIIVGSLSPNSGAVGAAVTITGTNFGTTQGSSTVTFNGTAAAATSWSSTSVAVTVPAGATTGNVVVTVGGRASNGVSFTVTASVPTISAVSPNSGAVGAAVTITGTNFGTTQGSSTVTFNGTAAAATNWSSTSVAVTVPAGATTGNVVVTVGGRASNGVSFTVTASQNITVSVFPKRGGITVQQTLSVTATTNDSQGVTWTATGGSFFPLKSLTGASVTYTPPSTAGTYTITATSVTNIAVNASVTVGVTDLSGVYTYHNDLSRDGVNEKEYALTTSNVNTGSFGKLFSCTVDGAIYAQPLWVANLPAAGVNSIIVATQHDSLYFFDADSNSCVQRWKLSLIDANHGGTGSEVPVPSGIGGFVGTGLGDITPEVGVTGTPVIDPSTKTLYVVSKSMNSAGTTFYQRLHAIDLTTGNERVTPQDISSSISVPGTGAGSVSGQVAFDPLNQNQRPGLLLYNGVVYVGWSSHEDGGPWHGWLMAFSASTLALVANGVFNSTPNQIGGGIWMGGGAPAVDSSGYLYLITGNGGFDANTGGSNYGDSVVKFSTTSGLSVVDYFAPLDQAFLGANDMDFGSGATTVLVDQTSGPVPHLAIGGGKEGYLFMLNRDNLGGFSGSMNNVVQTINLGNSIYATPVFWQNNLYIVPVGNLRQFILTPSTGQFRGAPFSQSATRYGFPGATPSLSSSGATNGILWALDNTLYCTPHSPGCGATVLHAYDATNVATDLWDSSQAAGDQAGNAVKFTVPTVANGKVYVGTRGNNTGGIYGSTSVSGELEVYGLKPN